METTTASLIGTDVDVYWNLHKHVWSVRDRKTRRVIAHLDGVVLSDVTFVVSAAGNARVRAEGRKNVHAFARGTVVATVSTHADNANFMAVAERIPPHAASVTYNPYKATTFTGKATDAPVHTASMAWLAGRSVWALDTTAQSGKVAV